MIPLIILENLFFLSISEYLKVFISGILTNDPAGTNETGNSLEIVACISAELSETPLNNSTSDPIVEPERFIAVEYGKVWLFITTTLLDQSIRSGTELLFSIEHFNGAPSPRKQ